MDEELVPTPLTMGAILADVDRQLADHPINVVTAPPEDERTDEDRAHLVRMDTHVRTIMASANSRLLALDTALGHTPPLTPLDEERIAAEVAAMYAYYYVDTSSDDEIPIDPVYEAKEHRPPTPYHVPDFPLSDSPSTHGSYTHDDITYALSAASIVSSRPPLSMPMMPTSEGSSSVEPGTATVVRTMHRDTNVSSPHRPRKLLKYETSDKTACYNACQIVDHTLATTCSGRSPPVVTIAETPPQWGQGPIHFVTTSLPVAPLAAAPPQWGHGSLHVDPAPVGQWQAFQWGDDQPHGPEPNTNHGPPGLAMLPLTPTLTKTSFPCLPTSKPAPPSKVAPPSTPRVLSVTPSTPRTHSRLGPFSSVSTAILMSR
jgi:hypothetical protein